MKNVLFAILFTASLSVFGQHESHTDTQPASDAHFRVSAAIAHTYLPEETAEGTKNLVLPTFAFDIEYWFNHHWGIGIHNDLELLNFEVEDEHHNIFIEREFPVLITLDALWKPNKNLVLFAGPGIELESNKNYFVFRAGGEYEIPFATNWDVAPLIFYDIRDGAYNTLTIGLGIGYTFGNHKKAH
jgi:hypothetical protein